MSLFGKRRGIVFIAHLLVDQVGRQAHRLIVIFANENFAGGFSGADQRGVAKSLEFRIGDDPIALVDEKIKRDHMAVFGIALLSNA